MTLVRDLRAIVGDRHVLTDRDVCAPYERDWTGRFSGRARAVVRPAATAEVADVLRACAEHGASVVPVATPAWSAAAFRATGRCCCRSLD
jgi:FAD/FMN-containing dehydrogenase